MRRILIVISIVFIFSAQVFAGEKEEIAMTVKYLNERLKSLTLDFELTKINLQNAEIKLKTIIDKERLEKEVVKKTDEVIEEDSGKESGE